MKRTRVTRIFPVRKASAILNPYSTRLPPFTKGFRYDGCSVDICDNREHAGDADSRGQHAEAKRAAIANLAHGKGRHSERQGNDHRSDPQIERRYVQCHRDQKVSREQQQRRQQDVNSTIQEQKPDRPVEHRQRRVDPVELSLQPVEFNDGFLDFGDDRQDDPKIAAAMLANNGLVLDRLCAEGALHRCYAGSARGLRRRRAASRAFAIASSDRRLSRFASSSARSATSEFRDRRVASASRADESEIRQFLPAEGTWHRCYGAIFNRKLVLAVRPSESLTSTRTRCSPGGNCASGISIPVACANGLIRDVRSTMGDLR